MLCNEYHRRHTADYSAVYCKSAVPYGDDVIKGMNVAIENDIIQPCADDCQRYADERRIDNVIQFYLRFPRAIRNVCERKDYAYADYHPVPHDGSAENRERHVVELEFAYSQSRKRNV